MRIQPFRGHPLFSLYGRSQRFRKCWNFQLRQGEDTRHRLQATGEEIYLILTGMGRMTVGGRTSDVREGEVIFVPPKVDHHLSNPACPLLKGVSIEAEMVDELVPAHGEGEDADAAKWHSARRLDEVVADLPATVDEAAAIRAIVLLFEIGSALSEQIETAVGLDNEVGSQSLALLEKKLMSAVVAIADRYRFDDKNFSFPDSWQ